MWQRSVAAAIVGLLFAVSACGDDDDSVAVSPEFCTQFQELVAGEPGPDEIRTAAESAPADAATALEAIATGFETDGESYFESTEFNDQFLIVGNIAAGCADNELAVTAIDYEFDGLDDVPEGSVAIRFENQGSEMHEMILFRRTADAEGMSVDDLFAIEDEAETERLLTFTSAAFAAPGGEFITLADLTPGSYIAACFIPLGSAPGTEGDGPPHFVEGMVTEFTIG